MRVSLELSGGWHRLTNNSAHSPARRAPTILFSTVPMDMAGSRFLDLVSSLSPIKQNQREHHKQFRRNHRTAAATGIDGDGWRDYCRVTRVEHQVCDVFLTEVHFVQWVQCVNIIGILNTARAVCVEFEQRRVKASVIDLARIECEHNASADEFGMMSPNLASNVNVHVEPTSAAPTRTHSSTP